MTQREVALHAAPVRAVNADQPRPNSNYEEHNCDKEFLKDKGANDERLFIHLIPHTHDDLGFIKTVE